MAPRSPRRPRTPLIFPLDFAVIKDWTMTLWLLAWSAVDLLCASLPRISRVISFARFSWSFAAASASRRSTARARSLSRVDSASAISSVLDFARALAASAPALASSNLALASSFWVARRSRSVTATSTAAFASAILPSHGDSAACAFSSWAPMAAISPLRDSSMASSAPSSFSTRDSSSAFFASSKGTSVSMASHSFAMSSRFLVSLATFSSSFLARDFIFLRSSLCLMSLRSNSANSFVARSSSFLSVFSSVACVLTTTSSSSTALSYSADLAFSSSSLPLRSATDSAILATLSVASLTYIWYAIVLWRRHSRSLAMKASASRLASSRTSFSFSTSLRRFTWPERFSLSSSSALLAASMGSTYWLVPMISSRYSRRPSSPGVAPLGFIMEICSTSPWRIRNRLLFRSTP
mmetsp:Transcript_5406/g.14510  ORF Transcript_5406/g.14510 Transcript_5406/m.14510 type:complete len:410 (-) Transcript_5406:501-1730(-)